MWELLQKIEKLWWKPYWKSIAELSETEKNIRLITSRSSWLWQFVCENGLMNKNVDSRWWEDEMIKRYNYKEDEYRLIESALTDEDKLEDFLLSNIRVDG